MEKLKKYGRPALFLLLAGLLIWNISLQAQIYRLKPQMGSYLPEDIYVAVGRTTELYNDQVVICGVKGAYILNWECEIGKNLSDRFSVEGKETDIGDHPLTLTIYDWNGRKVKRLLSTLHVVDDRIEGNYSILNIGDSLSNGREWYRTIFYLSDGQITFTGTRGWTKYSHEGRSGFSPQDYLKPTPYQFEGEGVQPFYDPVQEMFDWKYYKLSTGKDPDVVQIFLGINGLKEDPSDSVDAIAQMADNIRRHDAQIPIYIVNTIYVGDQDHIGNMELPDESPWLVGEYKLGYDRKVLHLMQALAKKLKGFERLTFIPLALEHDSAHNFDEGEALHPNEAGYQQFADCMYSVYCGTLEAYLPQKAAQGGKAGETQAAGAE